MTALIVLNGVANPASLLLRFGGRGKGGLGLGRDRGRSLSFRFFRSISDHQCGVRSYNFRKLPINNSMGLRKKKLREEKIDLDASTK